MILKIILSSFENERLREKAKESNREKKAEDTISAPFLG
jgi:hypothetical protein